MLGRMVFFRVALLPYASLRILMQIGDLIGGQCTARHLHLFSAAFKLAWEDMAAWESQLERRLLRRVSTELSVCTSRMYRY